MYLKIFCKCNHVGILRNICDIIHISISNLAYLGYLLSLYFGIFDWPSPPCFRPLSFSIESDYIDDPSVSYRL